MVRSLLCALSYLALMSSVQCQRVGIELDINLSLKARIGAGGACVSGDMEN